MQSASFSLQYTRPDLNNAFSYIITIDRTVVVCVEIRWDRTCPHYLKVELKTKCVVAAQWSSTTYTGDLSIMLTILNRYQTCPYNAIKLTRNWMKTVVLTRLIKACFKRIFRYDIVLTLVCICKNFDSQIHTSTTSQCSGLPVLFWV